MKICIHSQQHSLLLYLQTCFHLLLDHHFLVAFKFFFLVKEFTQSQIHVRE